MALILTLVPALGCGGPSGREGANGEPGASGASDRGTATRPAEWRREVEAFRARRNRELREPDGWLSLVGLYWLEPGRHTFGSSGENDLVLDGGDAGGEIPPTIGTFALRDGTVRFVAAEEAEVTHDGSPVDSLVIHDAGTAGEGSAPTLELDPLSWYVIERQGELGVRVRSSAAPRLRAFDGLETYPIRAEWRLEGRFESHDPPKVIEVPTVLGTVRDHDSVGTARFEIDGTTYSLDFWWDSPDDETLFTAFGDATNGSSTYGGGRFLRIHPPDEDGRVFVDFNVAYNPPCAFTPYSTCPLPPPQNRLDVAVEAGERDFEDR